MKLIHLSDLHMGKRVNEFSLLEDQSYILQQILGIVEAEEAEGVIIAGDVYDKPVPSVEAVQVLDRFLNTLAGRGRKCFLISGNHDSAQRLSFGAGLMDGAGVYVSPVYDGQVKRVSLADEYGEVDIYLLPFLKPSTVRFTLDEEGIESYQDAVAAAIGRMEVDGSHRNVLVAHQFITGAGRCDSEEVQVGGLDNVDASCFDAFDYVALGHIHSPQTIGRKTLRYCGTPLKYSFSEAEQEKSVTVVELKEKGNVEVRTVPLKPLRDMRIVRGSYQEVMSRSFYQGTNQEDYLHIILTDEEDIPDGLQRLRTVYPNLMRLSYDNKRTRGEASLEAGDAVAEKTGPELFSEFYEKQNNQPVSDGQQHLVQELWERLKEGGMA